jgi:hypothetical protein
MTTATLERAVSENDALTLKALRNAEYMAMLGESFRQLENSEVVTMTFTEWGEWLKNGCPELYK